MSRNHSYPSIILSAFARAQHSLPCIASLRVAKNTPLSLTSTTPFRRRYSAFRYGGITLHDSVPAPFQRQCFASRRVFKGLSGSRRIFATRYSISTSSNMVVSIDTSKSSAWSSPGPSAFDFRSDTITTPNLSMLQAIQNTTLSDDVYCEDNTTNALESHLATLTNHEAGLFVLSGTMGNQLAMRSHLTQPPYSVLCDYRAHLIEWEAGGTSALTGAMMKGVVPKNGVYLTLEDITRNVVISDDVHACPTRVISLENTLGGTIMPSREVKRISAFAKEHDIRLHLDGARLWEAVAAGAGSLDEYTQLFDSVTMCFSKGLGAPVGSILVGSRAFIKHARWVRKSIGGGLRQTGILTAAARVALDETFGKGVDGEGGKLQGTHALAKRIAQMWVQMGGKLDKQSETNMVWLDLQDAGISDAEFSVLGKKYGLTVMSGRLVVHYQISEEAIEKLKLVMEDVFARKGRVGNPTDTAVGARGYGTEQKE